MVKLAASLFVIASVVGCGDDGGKGANKDAAIDSKLVIDAPPIDAPPIDAPPGTFPLTVKNYISWCSVSIDGAVTSVALEQTVNLLPGTYMLVGKAKDATFQIGPNMWHHTTLDTGAGETGAVAGTGLSATSTVSVTVGSAAKCVWVCCPFSPGGSGCDPGLIGEQCP